MKVAYIHDWLIFPGWGEKVFSDIIYWKMPSVFNKENFNITQEEIFTNFYNPNYPNFKDLKINYILSSKNISKYYRNLMPFFPYFTKRLSKKLKKYNPDLIIISSFAIGKNIKTNKKSILYLHSPMQYIWSHYQEYLKKFKWTKKIIYKISSNYLRKWDKKFTNYYKICFNSNYTKKLYNEIYNKNCWWKVIFPLVEKLNYKKINIKERINIDQEYYIYIWRLVKLVKNLDKIIKIFNETNKKLLIIGDWPDKQYLKNIANSNIQFLWYIPYNSNLYWNLLKNAKAVINMTKESFGIVNYQAWILWTKIISINDWAIQDIPWDKILLNEIKDLKNFI